MDCETCKNYEKKEDKDNIEKGREHLNKLTDLCGDMYCKHCPLGPIADDCPLWNTWKALE